MEKISSSQNDRLLNYLDGNLSGAEAAMLKKELEASAPLRQRLDELKVMHDLLMERAAAPVDLSTNFTSQVMRNLDRMPQSRTTLSPRNGLLLFGGIVVSVAIGIFLLASGFFDQVNAPITLDRVAIPEKLMRWTPQSIPFNGRMIMKVLIVVNLGLALLVLDKTVLKPYFQRKHRTQSLS